MESEDRITRLEANKRRQARRKKVVMLQFLVCALIALIAVGFLAVFIYTTRLSAGNQIGANIQVDGVDVSGMTKEDAAAALTGHLDSLDNVACQVQAGDSRIDLTMGDLGLAYSGATAESLAETAFNYTRKGNFLVRFVRLQELKKNAKNIPTAYAIDQETAAAALDAKADTLAGAAVDASVIHTDDGFAITDGKNGVALDTDQTITALDTAIGTAWNKDSLVINAVMKEATPRITADMLTGIHDLLGSYSTNCGTSGTRVQNVTTGTSRINGSIVLPGEEFSANAAMEPYTAENGYGEAGSYENGQVVDTMGGGICQVSSTLYNALLYSELQITERYEHSMLVTYVDPGMDAAIADTTKDLKFVNNTDTPILIEGYIYNGNVYFNIYGKDNRESGRILDFVSETTGTTAASTKYVAGTDTAIGTMTTTTSGQNGRTATLWKYVYKDGAQVSKEAVNYSTYQPKDTVITVGVSSTDADAVASVKAAIATQDEATIKSAVEAAKAKVAAEQQTAGQ